MQAQNGAASWKKVSHPTAPQCAPVASLDEIKSQCAIAEKLLPNCVFYMMMAIWADDQSNIAWSEFDGSTFTVE
eukprot:3496366-Karenia_brevis.AAC.1